MSLSTQPHIKIKLPALPANWLRWSCKWFLGLALGGTCIYCLSYYMQRKKHPPFVPRQRGKAGATSPTSELHLQRRSHSPASTHTAGYGFLNGKCVTHNPQQLGAMGVEALDVSVQYWQDALEAFKSGNPNALPSASEVSLCRKLEHILTAAYALQDEAEHLFLHDQSIIFQTEETRTVTPTPSLWSKRTFSTSSFGSFYSAEGDILEDVNSFEHQETVPELYDQVLHLVEEHSQDSFVPCRCLRTEMLGCKSDNDFLVKLHCVRLAFQNITNDYSRKNWLIESGRNLLSSLFKRLNREAADLISAYDSLVRLLAEPERWKESLEEFKTRGIVCVNFFDIVLDFVLLDSFEDLEAPPSAVLAIIKNRWLSNGFKESAMATACMSVLKNKQRKLKYSDAFLARFYALNQHLAPALAWGFLGTDEALNKTCCEFKDDVIDVLCGIFDTRIVSYDNIGTLELDIVRLLESKLSDMSNR
ncbi:mitoguardin-like isoform X1 [Artemia franciscana]|uniref:Protein FAM73B n=1 Tax=Artemia franciscana TaxID=6661 RepID=A0AA88H8F3_ARTSF|nr:hypothetical protein QYM36_014753 [Artemia franciscana]